MKIIYTTALLVLIAQTPAWANVVWPALMLQSRLLSWWIIIIGLVIEYVFIQRLFNLSPKRALLAILRANAFSTLAGLLLIPLVGLVWEFLSSPVFYFAFGWGTFNPVSWVVTVMFAGIINSLLESYSYRKYLKIEILLKSRTFWWIFLANILSAGIAMASLFMEPPERTIGVAGTLRSASDQPAETSSLNYANR